MEYDIYRGFGEGLARGFCRGIIDLSDHFGKKGYPREPFPSRDQGFVVDPREEDSLKRTLPLGLWYYSPVKHEDKIRTNYLHYVAEFVKYADSVKILTVSGESWGKNIEPINRAIRERGHNAFYQFLLVNPEDERGKTIILERQMIGGAGDKEYFGEIEICRDFVKTLKDRKINADLRFYTDYPFWRLFIINDKITFVQTYPKGKAGDFSEAFGFHNLTGDQYSLAGFLIYLFDIMFRDAVSEDELRRRKEEAKRLDKIRNSLSPLKEKEIKEEAIKRLSLFWQERLKKEKGELSKLTKSALNGKRREVLKDWVVSGKIQRKNSRI